MKLKVCAVHDEMAKAYMRPMFVPAKGLAIRSFLDEANRPDKENTLYQHPEDFALYYLGEWDEETGEFETLANPELLMSGRNAKKESA